MTDAAFWDRIADRYVARPIADKESYEYTLARTRSYLQPTDRILELGCGSGSTALLLAPGVKQVTATDISGRMIEIGRAKAAAAGVKNVDFAEAKIGDTPQNAGGYDAVLALNLLHLVEDIPRALAQIHKRVKPGGKFISKTVCQPAWPMRLAMGIVIPVLRMMGKAPHVQFLPEAELDAMIERAGFRILETCNRPKSPPAHYVVAERI